MLRNAAARYLPPVLCHPVNVLRQQSQGHIAAARLAREFAPIQRLANSFKGHNKPVSTLAARWCAVGDTMASTDKDLYAKEQQLLLAAKTLDQALVEKDTSLLDKVFANDIVLHADRISVKADIEGSQAVKKYYSDYWDNYEYKHSPVVSAANGHDNVAFTFAVDEDVKPKSGGPSSLSVSVWAYNFTDELKISEIWFLRSLTQDEVDKYMKKPPGDLGLSAAEYHKMREPQLGPDNARTEALHKAAVDYSAMWSTGKPAELNAFVDAGFREVDPLLGNEINDRSGLEHAIKSLALMWNSTSHSHQIAVTPDSLKAFVLWRQRGNFRETNKPDSLYGLNLILFDKQHKIETVVGFRQIMETEKPKLLK